MKDQSNIVPLPLPKHSALHISVEKQCLALGAAKDADNRVSDIRDERDKRRLATQFDEWEAARQQRLDRERREWEDEGERDPR